MKIAIITPTNRPETINQFLIAWSSIFQRHNAKVYIVYDGELPCVEIDGTKYSISEVMGNCSHLIHNFNDGVRNLGFALAYKQGADIFISLDDDVRPIEGRDAIQEHLDALEMKVQNKWMNTVNGDILMRGIPYSERRSKEVVLSHGGWRGVADFDSSTQLVMGTPELTMIKTVVPYGVLFPMCIMNVAFKRKIMPFMYQAPMYSKVNRFADIWCGIEMKQNIDSLGLACVTGFSEVKHERASNPFKNLIKEAVGIEMNEHYGFGEYFDDYQNKRQYWIKFLSQ